MPEFVFILIGFVMGYIVAKLISSNSKAKNLGGDQNYVQKSLFTELQTENKEKGNQIAILSGHLAAQKEKTLHFEERLLEHKAEIEVVRENMNLAFKDLSNGILEKQSSKFVELNEEKVNAILNPLKEKIRDFETKVDKNYTEEAREKASLKKELEQIVQLNKQVSEEATRLTNALKGDKKLQGNWGEIQLEMILNKAGLEKGIHYSTQETFLSEDGKSLRPDYVLYLPDNKNLILDSKVSLVAYEQYFNEEGEVAKQNHIKSHVLSLNKHIAELSDKNYQKLYNINPPDYVLMFVPIEPALFSALREDARIFEKALEKNIVLVSTSTLLATLRTITYIWKQDNQRRNVAEIAEESGQLYDKFVGFTDDLINLGKKLEGVRGDYTDAMNKLVESKQKGATIVGRMERIKKLGANTTKSISQGLLNRISDSLPAEPSEFNAKKAGPDSVN
jgi:DNA recombination protein RmuC